MKTKNVSNRVLVTDGARAGQINLCGEFNFDTVTAIYQELLPSVQQGQVTHINLSKITASNTAGLGLLLSLMKASKQQGHALRFENLPPSLIAIAAVTGVSQVLSIQS